MMIQKLNIADYDSFYRLRLESLEHCPGAYTTDAQAWKNAPKDSVGKLLVNSQERMDMPILGAWIDKQLAGIVGMRRDLRPSVLHKATLWGLYVSPACRRQHIGHSLISEIITLARGISELTQLRAVVNVDSREALALFAQSGFQEFGREPQAKRIGDTFFDQIYVWYDLKQKGNKKIV